MRLNSGSIKVLHIISDLSVGGAEMMLYRLLSEMDEERFNCSVISLKNNGALRGRISALGIPVYTLDIERALTTPASGLRLLHLLHRIRPDLIQGWMPHGNLAALLASAVAPGRPSVLWNIRQSLDSLDYEKPITLKAIRLAAWLSDKPSATIYNSRAGAAQHAAFGYNAERSVVIYNGFDTKLFAPSKDARLSLRSELGVAENGVLIGLISRYHAIKNHSNFLRAAALLQKQHTEVRFVLSGRGINWNNQPLRLLIQELGLMGNVHLLGERQDTERIIAALDIAVSASHGEGFPNTIGEAMSCAVPCVVTDVSDLSWIIKGAGLVVPKNNSAAMARAFMEMLEMGATGREALGRAGRARVMEHFRLDSVAAQYGMLYESVVSSRESEQTNLLYRPAWENYSDKSIL
ncbi:MAG: glycosyltransferase [Pyrinomonadaceae bacterium]|nr:glycosyltransferase [Pyrinomonadaceae bacterium]